MTHTGAKQTLMIIYRYEHMHVQEISLTPVQVNADS